MTWTVKSSFLLSCKPTNKDQVPKVTLMTWQSSENTQVKAFSEWCADLTREPQHMYHKCHKSQAAHRALPSPLGSASNWDGQRSGGKATVMNIKAVLYNTGTNLEQTGADWEQGLSPHDLELSTNTTPHSPLPSKTLLDPFIFGQILPLLLELLTWVGVHKRNTE